MNTIKQKISKKNLYEFRKNNSLCVNCGQPATVGLKCQICKDDQDRRNKERYQKNKLIKICIRCGKKDIVKFYCDDCTVKTKKEKKDRLNRWREEGLCTTCGSERDSFGLMCRECLIKRRDRNLKVKQKVIDAYGGFCVCCGDTFIGRLTIDHINSDGAEHRRQLGNKGGSGFYQWLIKNKFPPGFQLLCASCNLCKHTMGNCPHGDEYVRKF